LGDFVALHNYWKNLFAGASSSQHCDKVGGGAPVFFSQRERERQRETETEETEEEEERKGKEEYVLFV
jgi:hypothetical protein